MRHASFIAALTLIGSTVAAGGPAPEQGRRQLVDQSYLCVSTLNDLRSLRMALVGYLRDHERLPDGTSIDNVKPLVQPMYMVRVNTIDAWGTPFDLVVSSDGKSFSLASAGAGSDRTFQREEWTKPGLLADSRADAVLPSAPGADREWVIQE
jgi:hypothetical protein